jgi:hypothetical protein
MEEKLRPVLHSLAVTPSANLPATRQIKREIARGCVVHIEATPPPSRRAKGEEEKTEILPESPIAAIRDLKRKAEREATARMGKMREMMEELLGGGKGEREMAARTLVMSAWTQGGWRLGEMKRERSAERGGRDVVMKGNRQTMLTAVTQTCLPGEVNRTVREKVVESMKREEKVERWIALLSDGGILKGLYRVESGEVAVKVIEVRGGPGMIKKEMIKKSFRYETSRKQFKVVDKMGAFDNVTDAVSLIMNN